MEFSVMLFLWFFILVTGQFTDDNNIYVEINPTTSLNRNSNQFSIYWNIPTFMCRKYGVDFSKSAPSYGISQNPRDDFRGATVAILYDPGAFPSLDPQRNGGVPQAGNLSLHLKTFADSVNKLIPEEDFKGLGIIDFESWRPIYRQNFGSLAPYKDAAIDYERKRHPFLPQRIIQEVAIRNFERYGRTFMEKTIDLARSMRPKASWGYYAYPYCFNMNGKNKTPNCPKEVPPENDRTSWLFSSSDALFPSAYLSENSLTVDQRQLLVRGRTREAMRVRNQSSPVFVYMRTHYVDTRHLLSKVDLKNALTEMKKNGARGAILWGSSSDLNSASKCKAFYEYTTQTLGPIAESFIS